MKALTVLLAAVAWATVAGHAPAQAPSPRLNVHLVDTAALFPMRDAEYLGAFRLPAFNGFDYCNCALAYDPDGNGGAGSLFIATFNRTGNLGGVAEVSIPTPVIAPTLAALPTATMLQPDTDALEGQLYLARTAGFSAAANVLGLQVRGRLLYINAAANYDADGTQSSNFFVRDKHLSTTSVRGPYGTTLRYQGYAAGYMANVPTMYRAEVGGDTISGMWSASIVTRESSGPAAFSYNTADLGPTRITPYKLIFYPTENSLGFYNQSGGGCGHEQRPIPCLENGDTQLDWNPGLSGHESAVIASGWRTIMFFGGLGVGPYGYGTATTDPSLNGKPNGLGDYSWYDPEEPSKGTHAYPYKAYYWLYRLDDALAVKNGTMLDEDAYPYEYGDISRFIPNWDTWYAGKQGIKGATWDESRRILYFAADKQDGTTVLIHALHIPRIARPLP